MKSRKLEILVKDDDDLKLLIEIAPNLGSLFQRMQW